jgi:hypothetical protein
LPFTLKHGSNEARQVRFFARHNVKEVPKSLAQFFQIAIFEGQNEAALLHFSHNAADIATEVIT